MTIRLSKYEQMELGEEIGLWNLIDFLKETMPTIRQGQDANVKFENKKWILWIVRTGDGSRSLRLEKKMQDGNWKIMSEIDAIAMVDEFGDCMICKCFVQRDGHTEGCALYDVEQED